MSKITKQKEVHVPNAVRYEHKEVKHQLRDSQSRENYHPGIGGALEFSSHSCRFDVVNSAKHGNRCMVGRLMHLSGHSPLTLYPTSTHPSLRHVHPHSSFHSQHTLLPCGVSRTKGSYPSYPPVKSGPIRRLLPQVTVWCLYLHFIVSALLCIIFTYSQNRL